MPLKLIGIDFGASNGRGILGEFDGSRLALAEIHRFDNNPVSIGKHLRWDIFRLHYELMAALRKASTAGHKDIGSIGVNTWGVDFGLLDQYGELMHNPLHYRDALTDSAMDGLRELIADEELYRRTGIQFMHFNTIYQLYALKKLYPSICERAARLLLLPDLFG